MSFLDDFYIAPLREDKIMKLCHNYIGRYGVMLFLWIFTIALTACSSDRTVNVSYNVSSKAYRCDSVSVGVAANPVHFVLPKDHGDMIITFITSKVFGFTQSYSDAIATNQFLSPFGETYTYSAVSDTLDMAVVLSDLGTEAAVLYYTDDNDVRMSLAKSVTGYQAGVYYISILDKDNNEIMSGQLPEGKSVLFLSESAKTVNIYSYVNPGFNNFFSTDPIPGTVAYENAYEIGKSTSYSDTKNVIEQNEEFSIIGSWKSVGNYGFGQAQPGAIVIFGPKHCNFYSPNDTYTFSYVGNTGELKCINWIFRDDVEVFSVDIIDNDNITITHGKEYTTVLERVK